MDSITVSCTVWIDASPERAWQAVTEEEQLSLWYSPGSPWEVEALRVGANVLFHHSPNEYHDGTEIVTLVAEIVEVEPLKKFAVRWEFAVEGPEMVTSFLIEEENGGTNVTITETGYETEEQAKPTEEGYAMSLVNLKAHLEGSSLPH